MVENGLKAIAARAVDQHRVVLRLDIAAVIVVSHDKVDDHLLVGKLPLRCVDIFYTQHILRTELLQLAERDDALVDAIGDGAPRLALHLACDAVDEELRDGQVAQQTDASIGGIALAGGGQVHLALHFRPMAGGLYGHFGEVFGRRLQHHRSDVGRLTCKA